jgi:hypothetical protein
MNTDSEKELKAQGARFKQIREHFQLGNLTEAGVEYGKRVNKDKRPIDRSQMAKFERGEAKVPQKILVELFSTFKINKEWFETGKGQMLDKSAGINEPEVPYGKEDAKLTPVEKITKYYNKMMSALYEGLEDKELDEKDEKTKAELKKIVDKLKNRVK